MRHQHRIAALECKVKQKYDPPKLTVIRLAGWVQVYWGSRLVKVIEESLYDAI